MIQKFDFTIFVSFHQFYLEDLKAEADTSVVWDEQALKLNLGSLPGLIAIGTNRWGGDIPVTLELLTYEPREQDFAEWDYVADCSIETQSGELTLSSPETTGEETARIKLSPGSYRVRVYGADLDSVGGPGDMEGTDHYRLVLWPGDIISPIVLKR